MRHLFSTILLLLCLSTLTGCFELIQQIEVDQGTSSVSFILNASQSKDRIHRVMTQDSIFGTKIPSRAEVEAKMIATQKKLDSLPSVLESEHSINWDDCIIKISMKTSSLTSFTKELKSIADKGAVIPIVIDEEGNGFKQLVLRSWYDDLVKRLHPQVKKEISDARLVTVYKSDKTIRSAPDHIRISKSKKSAMAVQSIEDWLKEYKNTRIELSFN